MNTMLMSRTVIAFAFPSTTVNSMICRTRSLDLRLSDYKINFADLPRHFADLPSHKVRTEVNITNYTNRRATSLFERTLTALAICAVRDE
jgi:hypothetical protein